MALFLEMLTSHPAGVQTRIPHLQVVQHLWITCNSHRNLSSPISQKLGFSGPDREVPVGSRFWVQLSPFIREGSWPLGFGLPPLKGPHTACLWIWAEVGHKHGDGLLGWPGVNARAPLKSHTPQMININEHSLAQKWNVCEYPEHYHLWGVAEAQILKAHP